MSKNFSTVSVSSKEYKAAGKAEIAFKLFVREMQEGLQSEITPDYPDSRDGFVQLIKFFKENFIENFLVVVRMNDSISIDEFVSLCSELTNMVEDTSSPSDWIVRARSWFIVGGKQIFANCLAQLAIIISSFESSQNA